MSPTTFARDAFCFLTFWRVPFKALASKGSLKLGGAPVEHCHSAGTPGTPVVSFLICPLSLMSSFVQTLVSVVMREPELVQIQPHHLYDR